MTDLPKSPANNSADEIMEFLATPDADDRTPLHLLFSELPSGAEEKLKEWFAPLAPQQQVTLLMQPVHTQHFGDYSPIEILADIPNWNSEKIRTRVSLTKILIGTFLDKNAEGTFIHMTHQLQSQRNGATNRKLKALVAAACVKPGMPAAAQDNIYALVKTYVAENAPRP